MRIALAIVGGILALDAGVTCMLLGMWAVRGHVPDFLTLSASGLLAVAAVLVKIGGGLTAAIQLWLMKQAGRWVAGVVATTNALQTLYAASEAGAVRQGMVWATIGLNAVILIVVALPAARRACRQETMRWSPGNTSRSRMG